MLDNLLKDVKCEREYNSTMSNIPSGPLLNLLHYQSDVESTAHSVITENPDTINGKKRKTSRYVIRVVLSSSVDTGLVRVVFVRPG